MFTFLAQDTWWQVLLGGLSETALVFAGAMALTLGGLLIRWVMKKMNITDVEKVKSVDAMYDAAVGLGIQYAAQYAHKLRDDPDASGKKLEVAVEFVQKMVKDWGLAEKSADWVAARVEAKLGADKLAPKPADPVTDPPVVSTP